MARWKLNADCVLPIEGVVFEQKLTTNTGRPCTERWPAHQLFELADPSLWNAEDEAGNKIIIVGLKPHKRDFVIDPVAVKKGWVPNPDMEPMDAEARAISAKIPRNVYPMSETALPSTGGHAPPAGSDIARFEAMFAAMDEKINALTERNAELEALLEPATVTDEATEEHVQ